ncbi:MAG TPA: SAM-dependent methyltransferase [Streptosporangiaceae bacterium]|nr:SAM-dependent methyltransferase [Streptosporangiaceae bacterium]
MKYALLILPSSNRVYADASIALTRAEVELFGQAALGGRLGEVEQELIGGVPYVTFGVDGGLSGREVALLANVSTAYALFAVEGKLLRPVELSRLDRFDDDLITIQKYQGKTNEQFTKLLLNVTLLASQFGGEVLDRKLAVLDPLCGRGTTLNQALMYGWDAAGLDVDLKDFEAYAAFIQTWLKRKRIKHQAQIGPVRRDRRIVARRLTITLAAEKDDYKAGVTQQLDVVNADTKAAGEFFRPESFHLVVADAPYGVRHGSHSSGVGRGSSPSASTSGVGRGSSPSASTAAGLARSPLDLLRSAVPGWARLLKPGGALGISWNTFVARRESAAAVLADAGLEVMDYGPYLRLAHRVDQAINRDILVARKVANPNQTLRS